MHQLPSTSCRLPPPPAESPSPSAAQVLRRDLGVRCILALTATCTLRAVQDVCRTLHIEAPDYDVLFRPQTLQSAQALCSGGVVLCARQRTNLRLSASLVPDCPRQNARYHEKFAQLHGVLTAPEIASCQSVIVYTRLKKDADEVWGPSAKDAVERLTTAGGVAPSPPPPGRPLPPQTKVIIAGKNEVYNWDNLVRPFWVHTLLGPRPPPPPSPPTALRHPLIVIVSVPMSRARHFALCAARVALGRVRGHVRLVPPCPPPLPQRRTCARCGRCAVFLCGGTCPQP